MPSRRQHRLGVELHALGGQLAVADAHETPAAARRRLEAVRQVRVDDERVVAPDGQRRGEPGEDPPPVVLDLRGLAVHGLALHDAPAEGLASDWWPRQTPSVGIPASGKRRTTSTEIPASPGVHGPGETTTRS